MKVEYMSEQEVLSIPQEQMPVATLATNADSLFALGIRWRRRATWSHFMWMIRPGVFASQGWTFSEVPATKYMGLGKRLKFWTNPDWTPEQRSKMIQYLDKFVKMPAYSTRYDWIAIGGQLLGVAWLQNPLTRICSEYGSTLCETGVDTRYDLKTPAPDQVDDWFNAHAEYRVLGRYAGE